MENLIPAVCELSTISMFIKDINNSSSLLEKFLNEVLERLTVINCCFILQRLQKIIDTVVAMNESESHFLNPFDSETFQVVQERLKRCEKFITAWKDWTSFTNRSMESYFFIKATRTEK